MIYIILVALGISVNVESFGCLLRAKPFSLRSLSFHSKGYFRLSSQNGQARQSFRDFMTEELKVYSKSEGLLRILCSIESVCKQLSHLLRRSALANDHDNAYELNKHGGYSINSHGERQLKLDVLANSLFKRTLCSSGVVDMIASEEEDRPYLCHYGCYTDDSVSGQHTLPGGYVVVIDPLDGSANVPSGLPSGSIFGVYRTPHSDASTNTGSSLCQKGANLVAAGYCLYSSAAHLVVTVRRGVHMFVLDEEKGQFVLARSHMRIPHSGRVYAFNEAYSPDFSPGVVSFLSDLKRGRLHQDTHPHLSTSLPASIPMPTARYAGTLVGDIHNILLHGGIFGYPATERAPRGKLRVVYEVNPIGAVVEEAGGRASDGERSILDVLVGDIHQ
ncbi:fructose-1,6-bisphosphatase, partial [archaeon]